MNEQGNKTGDNAKVYGSLVDAVTNRNESHSKDWNDTQKAAIDRGVAVHEALDNMFKRGGATSQVPFIPLGEKILIKGVGITKEMSLMTDESSAKVALTLYVAGIGDAVIDSPIKIGDKVDLDSTEEFVFKHIEIASNKQSIVNRIVELGKTHNLSGLAKTVAHDKAKSKIALNHTSIVDPNTIKGLNSKVVDLDGKEVLFGQKDVEVVEYYTTPIRNIDGIYVEIPKEAK